MVREGAVGLLISPSWRGCGGADSPASIDEDDVGTTTEDELNSSEMVGIIGVGREERDDASDVFDIAYVTSSCRVPLVGGGEAGEGGT